MMIKRGGKSLTKEQAAEKLGVKVDEVADAGGMVLSTGGGETVELPWVKTADGTEYVWRKTFAANGMAFEESIWVVAGTHTAAPGSLAVPDFDPHASPVRENSHWPHRDDGVGPQHRDPKRIQEVTP